jgi:hypothetical protein
MKLQYLLVLVLLLPALVSAETVDLYEAKENYKDGKLHGSWEFYHENGKLEAKENYKDGKRISRTCFTESGEVRVCGP